MAYFEFPHTRTYDSDLGWLIKHFKILSDTVSTIDSWKYLHEIEYENLRDDVDGLINNLVDVISPWDSSIAYHVFSIVEYQGTNYIAVQDVPVGAMITNTDYWQPANTVVDQINAMSVIVSQLQDMKYWYYPEDFGAVGDGVTDDAQAFQTMFNTVPRDSVIILQPKTYLVNSPLVCETGMLTIGAIGGRNEFKPQIVTNMEDSVLLTFRASGISLYNFELANTASETGTLLLFDSDSEALAGNIDALLDNVALLRANIGVEAKGRNIRAYDCLFSTMVTAIQIDQTTLDTDIRGFDVTGNRFHQCKTVMLYNASNNKTTKNVSLRNNFADGCSNLFTGYSGGVVIDSNYIDCAAMSHLDNYLVRFMPNPEENLDVKNYVTNNILKGNIYATVYGVSIESGVTADVLNNEIVTVRGSGITITSDKVVVIKGNIIDTAANILSGMYPIVFGASSQGHCAFNTLINCEKAITKASGSTVTLSYNVQ